ncbi:MAG: YtxH domain-containing protein [Planctomycetes bacterium]|nr:YtxH domain-containing protein [Planctomycetota bacterium]
MVVRYLLDALVGGSLGFLYYKFIGCRTRTCPITSTPPGTI